MTGENRKLSIAEALAWSSDAFRAARKLIDAALPYDAIARAYYAAFHVARAALLSRGIEAKSLAGMIELFDRELTAKNVLPSFDKLLGDIQAARETADCKLGSSFTVDEAREVLGEAERFSVAVCDLLKREGWLA